MKIKHTADYQALRRASYPPIADFADALYWFERGHPEHLRAYYAAVEAVKARYPKRGEPLGAPGRVTRRQARQALLLVGLLDDVETAIAAIEDPVQRRAVEIDWNDALDFERDNPTLLALAGAVGLDDSALDDLFRVAAALNP